MDAGTIGRHRRHGRKGRVRTGLLAVALAVGFGIQAAATAYAAPPVARDVTVSTRESVAVWFFLDSVDPDNDDLTYEVLTQPTHGSVDECSFGFCTYTPTPGYTGADSFTWRTSDGTSPSNTAAALISVQPNVAPVARNQTISLRQDTPRFVFLDYTDVDHTSLTFTVLTQPQHGNVDDCSIGYCTYTPNPGFVGADSFTWRVADDLAQSGVATMTLSVFTDVPPVANDSTASVRENKVEFVDLDWGQQPDENLTFSVVDNPAHGVVECAFYYGQCSYQAFPGYTGPDSFTWKSNDGLGDSRTAKVSITVRPNAVPEAADAAQKVYSGFADFYLDARDRDDDPLDYEVLASTSHGILDCDSFGGGFCEYQPQAGFTGVDSFTWRAADDLGATSRVATVTIHAGADGTPVAYNGSWTVVAGQATPIGFWFDDDDFSGSYTFSIVSQPAHGSVTSCSNQQFQCTYTPAPGYTGPDSYTWRVSDGTNQSNVATVWIDVVDHGPPVANDQSQDVRERTPTPLFLNGYDPDGTSAAYSVVTPPAHGTLSGCEDGVCTYTSANGYLGTDSFQWKVTSGGEDSRVATFTITVQANNPPTAFNQSQRVAKDQSTVLGLSWTDNDFFAEELTFTAVTQPSHGTLTDCSTGACTYTPAAGYVGPDSFQWKVSDGLADSNTVTYSLFVSSVAAPVAVNSSVSVRESRPQSFFLNWSSPDGLPLSFTVVTPPSHGTVDCPIASGLCTYTPTAGYVGPDSFTWKANDGFTDSNTATVSLTVTANHAPVATSVSTWTTASNTPLQFSLVAEDADSDLLTYAVQSGPSHGTLSGCTLVTTSLGSCTYTPAAGYVGPDSLTFTARDDLATSDTATVGITVTGQAPVANAGADQSGTEGFAISLTGTASDPDGQPLTYQWTATPGVGADAGAFCFFSAPTSLSTTVTCTDDGSYTVTLTASDGGSTGSDSAALTLTNANPTVAVTAPAAGAEVPFGATVTVSATITDPGTNDGHGCNIAWGDATTTAGAVVGATCTGTHTYASAGARTITVDVTDDDAGAGSDSVGITVLPEPNLPPTASAGDDASGTEGGPVTLTGSGSDPEGRALTYSWSYAAGSGVDAGTACSFGSPTSAGTSFTCTDDGTFTVTLAVSDGVNPPVTDSATVTLANADPTVSVTAPAAGASVQLGATLPLSAALADGGSHDTHTCSIAWGDGSTTTGTVAAGTCTGSHSYAAAGDRTITVTVTDDDGGTGSASRGVSVLQEPNEPPTVDAGDPLTVQETGVVTANGSASDPDGDALTYAWSYQAGPDVDGGATCTFSVGADTPTPNVSCTDDGTFTLTLSVSDGSHDPVTDTTTLTVTNREPLGLAFSSPEEGASFQVGETVNASLTITELSPNDTHTCVVDWGDDVIGVGTVSGGSCTATHVYGSAGDRIITATVTDDDGGATSASVGIAIVAAPVDEPPTADAGGDKAGTEGATVSLNGSGSDPEGKPLTYAWSSAAGAGVDAGTTCSFGSPSAAHTTFECDDDGTFTVTLSVSDGVNPPVTDTATVTLANADPTVTVTAPAAGSEHEVGVSVSVSASTTDAGAHDSRTCTIAWGDGTTTGGTMSPAGVCTGSHGYDTAGDRIITVTVTDDDGGSASDSVAIVVTTAPVNEPPTADAGGDKTGTEGAMVSLNGSGSDPEGKPLSYAWSYTAGAGVDAGTSCAFGSPSAADTTFRCDDDGTFTVTLTVSDGVNDAVTDSATVTLANADPTVSITAPAPGSQHQVGATVSVSATTSDPGAHDTRDCSIAWGDGSTSAGNLTAAGTCSGSHSYNGPGQRSIMVTVTDDDDGTASATVAVTVASATANRPPKADAGHDQTGTEGSAVTLRGSGSDPEKAPLSFRWTYAAGSNVDAGTTCTFGSPTSAKTSFTCTDNGPFTVKLAVDDGVNPPVADTAVVKLSNAAPTVKVSTPRGDSSTKVGQVVDVSAKVADRGANDTLTCSIRWGDGSTSVGTISGDRCTGSHTYQKAATLTVTVSVTDDDRATGKDSVCITVRPVKTNRAPSVDAGRDVTATAGSTIRLHAEAKDRDGDRLTYAWTLKAGAGTGCSFRDATTGHSTRMVCARAGTVWATVTVSDGVNAPVSDTVKVTVRAPQDPCATTPGSGAPKAHGRRRR